MKRNKRQPSELIFTFVPAPQPAFGVGLHRLRDGAVVTVKIVEWLATIRKYVYYLTIVTPTTLLKRVTVVTEAEMRDYLGATAVALEAA